MSQEIVVSIVSGLIGFISASMGFYLEMQKVKMEREKLRTERDKLQVEHDKLQMELRESAKNLQKMKAEIAKLRAEADKFSAEAADLRRRWVAYERNEVRVMLIHLERAFFNPNISNLGIEVGAMFRAMRETRIALQQGGASLVINEEAAQCFSKIENYLLEKEREIVSRFPKVLEMEYIPILFETENEWKEILDMLNNVRKDLAPMIVRLHLILETLNEGLISGVA